MRRCRRERSRRCRYRISCGRRIPIRSQCLVADGIFKSFGGIKAVQNVDVAVADRSLHALIGPIRRGQDHRLQPALRHVCAGSGRSDVARPLGSGVRAGRSCCRRHRPLVSRSPICFPTLSVAENIRLATQARHPRRADPWTSALSITDINEETAHIIRYLGLRGMESAEAGAFVLRRGSGCSTWALRSPPRRGCCCSTNRSPVCPPPSGNASAPSSSAFRRRSRCCWLSTTSTACSSSPITSRS